VRELVIKDENLQAFYEDGKEYGFKTNEYIKVYNPEGNVIYLAKWNGSKVVPLKWKKIDVDQGSAISPLNDEQRFLFDMLQDENIIGKFVLSPYGTGKTMVSMSWALNEISNRKSKYNKIHYIRNNIGVANTVDLGALPQGANEKLYPWAAEIVDILGSKDIFDLYVEQERICLEHLGWCRGRSWDNSIIFLEEAQNCSAYHLSLCMSRVGKNSCLICVGDLRQTDKDIFKKDSGMLKAINVLQGNPMFGMVTLVKNERSAFSSLADLLLEDK
jgi:PhoH-like ATPase